MNWILTKDALPEENIIVLIYSISEQLEGVALGRYAGNGLWQWLAEQGADYWTDLVWEDPIAWMYIPRPPAL